MSTDTRPQFEDATWAHYRGLKARGWSHPDEGDPNSRESLFWREANGQYGVRQIEAAWRGWLMREAAVSAPKIVNRTFQNGMTVADLKALIRDWPETDGNDEPCEVWIETGDNLSNMVCVATPLNYRVGEAGKVWADILLGPHSSL